METNADATPIDVLTLPCVSCGYDLRDLPGTGQCPECGTSIARSRSAVRLARADPDWLRRIARGQTVFAIGFVLCAVGLLCTVGVPIVFGIVLAILDSITSEFVETLMFGVQILVLVGLGTATVGAILVTAQDPREQMSEGPWSPRRLARLGVLTALGVFAVDAALEMTLSGPLLDLAGPLVMLLLAGAMTVAVVAVLTQLERLARRIPDEDLAVRAGTLAYTFRWAIPAFAIVTALSGLAVQPFWTGTTSSVLEIAAIVGRLAAFVVFIVLLVQFVRCATLAVALRAAFATCVREARHDPSDG